MDSFDISQWAEDHSENPTASKLFPQDKLADIKKCAFVATFISTYWDVGMPCKTEGGTADHSLWSADACSADYSCPAAQALCLCPYGMSR